MKHSHKQQGKGLIAFLAGSVVALMAIALMLITLNRNSDTAFKQPELVKPQQPEILTPNNASSVPQTTKNNVTPATNVTSSVSSAAVSPSLVTLDQLPNKTKQDVEFINSMALSDAGEVTVNKNIDKVAEPTVAKAAKPAKETLKGEGADDKNVVTSDVEDVKPTAQQILDSGNLEKARESVRKEAKLKAEVSSKAKTEGKVVNKAGATKGSISIQAGAYGNKKSAEEQRAKLALMGVQTKVVAVESNGKTVYRVQTDKIQGEQAAKVQNILKNNGVDTYTYK